MIAKGNLKLKLASIIGLLALASALLISQYASRLSRTQIERDQSALLQNIAIRMVSQLAQDMSTRANEVLFLAGQERIRDPKFPLEKKRGIFERARNAYPFYAWIGMTDTEGNIIAGTDGLLVGKSVAQRDWFLKGKDALHFGDAHDAFLLAKLLPKPQWDDLPLRLVDISAPIHDENGKFIGVICGHLSLDWAFEARERMLDQLSKEHLDLIVLNRDGKVLMGTPQLPSLKVELASLKTYQGLAANLRHVSVEAWPDGKRYLTAAVRESTYKNYPGMGWSVIARRDEADAFGPAEELSKMLILGGLATALLFSAILWIVLNRQLRPLERIASAAKRIQEENVAIEIPQPEGEGEVAVFARSLTGLVNSLQAKNSELKLASRVFDESGQGILISDANNRVLRVNRAFTRITGYALDDVAGKSPAVLQSRRQTAEFYRSMWAAINRQGTWQGEIWNRSKSGHIYPEWLTINTLKNEAGEITHYIGIFDDITEKKEYERRLVHLANYDQLTDLPNRHLMSEHAGSMIEEASRNGHGMAMIFIDLDKFKHINDTLGHPAGDDVLREVASRFQGQVGPDSLLARWGGDEFVLAIPRSESIGASAMAKQLIDTLQRPFSIQGSAYHIAMSAGIALYPGDGETVDALLRCADTAMYKAKQEGSNFYRFYESTMNAGVERFLKVDNALRHSLNNGGEGLNLAFQAQYSSDGKSIMGAEILARWFHHELGEISPGQFIPVAEDTGQIVVLGRWILDKAMRAFVTIRQAGCPTLPLSLNCSAHQLRDSSFVRDLQKACMTHGVRSEDLVIEVTESAIMSEEFKAMATLTDLRSLGFRISIDDFGTGYSCLNYIQKIRPSEIKIDQSFVRNMLVDPDSRNIVDFTMGLAQSMGLEVVAEGVETEDQRAALQSMGKVKLQGYLLARPMPLEDYVELMKQTGRGK